MKTKTGRMLRLGLGCALAGFSAWARFDAPAPTRAQIEADWLRQDDLRLRSSPAHTALPTPVQDAAGGVDGVKNGRWGFHTDNQENPWWQVDLGSVSPLGRLLLWNRCDALPERNSRIRVLVSDDAKTFRQVYRHNGTLFLGSTDGKPLEVDLRGAPARYLRLDLSGTSYFHLDEVEVFPPGSNRNIALGKPATQSSTSQWSAHHASPLPAVREYPAQLVVERGLKLAASQRRLGAAVESKETFLKELLASWQALPKDAPEESRRALYLRAHWMIREMALANPLANFDRLLFVKRAPGMFPHISDQHYGWWSRGGGGVYVLEGFKTSQPRVHCLTGDMPEGSFIAPDLSFDGRKVLFAYCRFHPKLHQEANKANKANVPEDAFYHIYEMNVDGSARRQLTHGKYDDFDPRWLPGGDIVFLSTRKGQALQCTKIFSDSTRQADLPDSYVRCGGDNYRPVPVFTLHAMDAAGGNIRPMSAFENFEWAPSVAADGRLLYTRWDYIDRFNGHFFSLWSANQDGTNPQLVYKNYTVKPQVALEARSVPGSRKLVFTASAHHSITGGSLCLLDRDLGTETETPLTPLTPEVPYPETGGAPEHYYANPWPLSEDCFLVAWADAKLPPHCFVDNEQNPTNAMGLYLYDAFGNQELLYRDPQISSMYPVPVAPRPKPPAQTQLADWDGRQEGAFLIQDVTCGLGGAAAPRIRRLRVVAVPPKIQPHMNNPVLGVSSEDPGKYVLGTVPVESDGSAHFRVPSGVPVFFQALDERGLAVQTMRSLTYVMPNQTLSCVGCHEHRDAAPSTSGVPVASRRAPSTLTPAPEGSWPLRFDRLVQPVLDRHCVDCHCPISQDLEAARIDLTPTKSWQTLLAFKGGDLKKLAFERDRSLPGQGVAANSALWKHLTKPGGHYDVKLDDDSLNRLATWMDTYAHRLGHYGPEQEKRLADFRAELSDILRQPPK